MVVTGTMRPPSAMGTEAYNNLLGAIILAGSQEARGMGVTVMLNDEINASREVTKQNSYRIQTFGTRELGFLGIPGLRSQACVSTGVPTRKHTHQSEFDISGLDTLPQVEVLYSYEGASDIQARALVDAGVDGIVIGSMGPGAVGTGGGNDALLEARSKGIYGSGHPRRAGAGSNHPYQRIRARRNSSRR